MRSPSVYKRPDRLLYSGNIPATPTSGSDRSRCPPFRWQLLQETLLGVNRAASPGVFVKIRNPHRISLESFDVSSDASVSGLRGKSHAVTIVVRDRGVGIKPEDMARAFDPYFTTKRTGSGLGLAIAKNIIEGMGGSIAMRSQPGEGTEIRIDIPDRASLV
jgi:signal transduction histidine kinase